MRILNISEKLLNVIGIFGLAGICSSIFYFNLVIFITSTVAVIFFVVISSLSVNFEPMDYKEIMRSVTEIMNTDKAQLILKQDTTKLSRLIEELDRIKKTEIMTAVVNKFASNVENESPKMRSRTARVFKKIMPSMQKVKYGKAYIDVNATFIDAEGSETDRGGYFEIADLLEKGIPWFVEKELYNKPNEIIKMFNNHSENKDQRDRAKWAFKVLKKIANKNLVELLIRALRSENANTQKEAYSFIKNMSNTPAAVNFNKRVVKELKDVDNEVANNLKNELVGGGK